MQSIPLLSGEIYTLEQAQALPERGQKVKVRVCVRGYAEAYYYLADGALRDWRGRSIGKPPKWAPAFTPETAPAYGAKGGRLRWERQQAAADAGLLAAVNGPAGVKAASPDAAWSRLVEAQARTALIEPKDVDYAEGGGQVLKASTTAAQFVMRATGRDPLAQQKIEATRRDGTLGALERMLAERGKASLMMRELLIVVDRQLESQPAESSEQTPPEIIEGTMRSEDLEGSR